MNERESGWRVARDSIFKVVNRDIFSGINVPSQCPFALLVKID
jgi:hypothetical protein